MPITPEDRARENIDKLLISAGWIVQDKRSTNLSAGRGVAVREFPLKPGHGEADYLLFVDGAPIGVVEAKKEDTLTGVELQTTKYSEGVPDNLTTPRRPLPFQYQSTGVETRFTNLLDPDARSRLRVLYDNGTESNLLMRSFQRSLHRDAAARLITSPDTGPLFAQERDNDDLVSGTIYVLRSKSDHPVVAANRDVLHKIGVTGSKVETRIANANLDPTFLMADVEIRATYEIYNINRIKLENLIHRVFDPAQLDIELRDRFGNPVKPREWFLVPLFVVNEVVERIKDGSITQYVYDPTGARLV